VGLGSLGGGDVKCSLCVWSYCYSFLFLYYGLLFCGVFFGLFGVCVVWFVVGVGEVVGLFGRRVCGEEGVCCGCSVCLESD